MLLFKKQFFNFEFIPISTKVYSESVCAWVMERFFLPHEPVAAQLLTVVIGPSYLITLPLWHEPGEAQLFTVPIGPLYCAPSKCLASLTGLLADLNKENNLFRIKLILKTFNNRIVAFEKCVTIDAI